MTQQPVTTSGGSKTYPAARRNLLDIFGLRVLDIAFWLVGMIIAFGIAMVWHLFLVDFFGTQVTNKYALTVMLLGLVVVWTVLSLVVTRRKSSEAPVGNRRIGGIIVRFGTAMLLFGTAITPIGLYYHNIPTRSVPVGFAYFTLVFIGIFITGFGGNMLAPPKQ